MGNIESVRKTPQKKIYTIYFNSYLRGGTYLFFPDFLLFNM